MTKIATKTKKETAAPIVAGEGYKELGHGDYKLADIEINENFRKNFNEKALQELAKNIAKVGVLQSVLLRRKDRGQAFILVAGERRYRAAKMAGLKEIPGRVLDLTEEQALEVQALENLHRKDLSPIEEARAFKVLLDQKGHTIEQVQDLADRVGKNASYVYRAVRLLELPEKALKKIEAGEWTPAHGHQLLRLETEEARKEAIEWINDGGDDFNNDPEAVPAASSLKNHIEENAKKLKDAIFPTGKEYAGCAACNACPNNTTNQSSLFDGAEKGQCLKPDCFKAKSNQAKIDKVEAMMTTMPAGVKNLGVKQLDYNAELKGLKGAKRYQESDITKGLMKVIQANPKAFGVAMCEPQYSSDAATVCLVCTDRAVLGEKPKPKEEKTDYDKENFVARFIQTKIHQEMMAAAPEQLNEGHLHTIITSLRRIWRLADVFRKATNAKNDNELDKMISNAGEKALSGFVLLAALACEHDTEEETKLIDELGLINVKEITKAAKAEALLQYQAQKAGKRAKPADQDED